MAPYWEDDDDDFDDDYDDEFDDEDEDDEDWEDDGEGDGWGQDIGSGFGREYNPDQAFGDYDDQSEYQNGDTEKDNSPEQEFDVQADEKRKKEEKKAEKGKKSKKEKQSAEGVDEKKIKKIAKGLGYPTTVMKFACPSCMKHSIFMDKYGGQLRRGITSAAFGFPSQGTIIRYVCLNPKCRMYHPKSGVKFSWDGAVLKAHKNIFHVVK